MKNLLLFKITILIISIPALFSCGVSGGSGGGYTGNKDYTADALFPSTEPWYKDVSSLTKSTDSDSIISWLQSNGGWGSGKMRIDFSIEVLQADISTQSAVWSKTEDWYSPDCDSADILVPSGGALEGESGYNCTSDGDCHLLVVNKSTNKLYEMWRANYDNGKWNCGCLVVWDLSKSYPLNLRGDQCTSADAGGFPMSALLFNANEVAAGEIKHAIRFILPNNRIRHGFYVRPATHSTNATSGGSNAPPYGVRFRLKSGFSIDNLPTAGAKVVARAMQKYGMILSDGGTIALTAQNDTFTTAKWNGLLGALDLSSIQVTDFEVVDMDTPIPYTGDCVRN
jgi:hypothetical protein